MNMQAGGVAAGALDVAAVNDALARRFDIDAYYARSSWIVRWIEGRRLAWIRSAANVRPGEELLEVGCGGGHVLRMFPQARLTGVDVSGVMLDKARRNLKGIPARLLQGELADLGLPEHSFDVIICTEVLEHVVDPVGLLDEMRRLLRPTGRAIITFPNDALIHAGKRWLGRLGLHVLPGFRNLDWGGDEFHLHQWTRVDMRRLLSRSFMITKTTAIPGRFMPIRMCFFVQSTQVPGEPAKTGFQNDGEGWRRSV